MQVLGDLSVAEFTRTMASITEWVSPEEGCNYCHIPENLASDDIYTKVVSRRMLQMTQDINTAMVRPRWRHRCDLLHLPQRQTGAGIHLVYR